MGLFVGKHLGYKFSIAGSILYLISLGYLLLCRQTPILVLSPTNIFYLEKSKIRIYIGNKTTQSLNLPLDKQKSYDNVKIKWNYLSTIFSY